MVRRHARQVSFRADPEAYEVLLAVAEGRLVDLTAVLNHLIADALPQLRQELSRRARDAAGVLITEQEACGWTA